MTRFAERFNTVKCLKSSLLTLKMLPKPGDCPLLSSRHERATRPMRLHAARHDANASMMMVVKIFTWMSHLRSQSGAETPLTYDLHLHDLMSHLGNWKGLPPNFRES